MVEYIFVLDDTDLSLNFANTQITNKVNVDTYGRAIGIDM